MSRETYMAGFNKMASACGVDANKLLCILGGNRRGGAHYIKSAQDGSGSKGFLANLGEAISSKWNGLTDNEKTLALGLAGAGGGGILGAGLGKITGFGTGKGAITGALLGGMGGAGYGMYSKEQKRLLGEIAKQKQEYADDTAKRDKAHAAEIARRDDVHSSEKSQMQARIDQMQKEMDQAAKARTAEVEGLKKQHADDVAKQNEAHAAEVAKLRALIAQGEKEMAQAAKAHAEAINKRDNTIKTMGRRYSDKIHNYSDEDLQKNIDVLNAEKGMRGDDRTLKKVEQTFPAAHSGSDKMEFTDQEADAFKAYKTMGYSDIQALNQIMKARRKK